MTDLQEKHSFWAHLIRPSDDVPKSEQRTASLLAGLLLTQIGIHVALVTIGLVYILGGRESSWLGIKLNLLSLGISATMYLVSRSRRYKIAAAVNAATAGGYVEVELSA